MSRHRAIFGQLGPDVLDDVPGFAADYRDVPCDAETIRGGITSSSLKG